MKPKNKNPADFWRDIPEGVSFPIVVCKDKDGNVDILRVYAEVTKTNVEAWIIGGDNHKEFSPLDYISVKIVEYAKEPK